MPVNITRNVKNNVNKIKICPSGLNPQNPENAAILIIDAEKTNTTPVINL